MTRWVQPLHSGLGALTGPALMTLVGQTVLTLGQWCAVLVLANGAGFEVLGEYALAQAVTAPVFLALGIGLRLTASSDVGRRFTAADYAAARALGMTAASLIAVLIGTALQGGPGAITLLFVVAARVAEGGSDVLYGIFYRAGHASLVGRSLVWRGVMTAAGIALVSVGVPSAASVAAAVAVAWLAVLAVHDWPASRAVDSPEGSTGAFALTRVRPLVLASAPAGLVLGIGSLTVLVPRYAVSFWLGPAALGVFVAAWQIVQLAIVSFNLWGQAAVPALAGLWERGAVVTFRQLWRRLAGATVLAAVGLLVVAWPLVDIVLPWLYPGATPEAGQILRILLVGLVPFVGASIGHYALTAVRAFWTQAAILSAVVVVGAALQAAWVPHHGVRGSAAAFASTAVLHAIVTLVLVERRTSPATARQGRLQP